MNKIIRLFGVLAFFSFVFSSNFSLGETPSDLLDQVSSIEDTSLKRLIENSVSVGLITTSQELDSAVARWKEKALRDNPAAFFFGMGNSFPSQKSSESIAQEISRLVAPLEKLDRDAMPNVSMNNNKLLKLFKPISGTVPPSYDATFCLAVKFNPIVGTDDSPRLDSEIDAYLAVIANDPCIQYALKTTGTSLNDLKKNWFGPGCGFEHVFNGEVKGNEVSGYHFWYKFYRDENESRTQYISTLQGFGDPYIYTGQFAWDPDGNGPMQRAMKKKGGFSVKNSPQAILAMGHIAVETCRKNGGIPGALIFPAKINGESFNWQLYTFKGTIRSLYPMVPKVISKEVLESLIREYYDFEVSPQQNLSVH